MIEVERSLIPPRFIRVSGSSNDRGTKQSSEWAGKRKELPTASELGLDTTSKLLLPVPVSVTEQMLKSRGKSKVLYDA